MTEFRVPRQKADPTDLGAGPWRMVASFAGFFGALPFGLVPSFLATEGKGPRTPASEILLAVLLGTLSLVPFAVALSRAGRDTWSLTLTLAIPAMIVGAVALFVYPFGLLVFLGAFGLGPLLGLAALVPCWRRGDAEGRALALLGISPSLLLLGFSAANGAWRLGDRDVEAAAPFRPSASLPPTGSGISPAASPPIRDLSWLWGWDSILALVAVGLAIGAMRFVWLRRRLRRLDAAGAEASRKADSPGREIGPSKSRPERPAPSWGVRSDGGPGGSAATPGHSVSSGSCSGRSPS